ncbi:MAG: hypothetical protein IKY82_07335 [Alistipes sp.]|nr:hypothetical protein [Alistipes sp.]
MKKLFTLLALSLVMIACNKEEENEQLTGWDKIIADMTRTDKSASEVLNSLQENEYWYQNAESYFFLKEGEVIEDIFQPEGELIVGGSTTMRFVDNTVYYVGMGGDGWIYNNYDAKIISDNNIKFSFNGKEVFEWKIIAYDENKLLIENYPLLSSENHPINGEYLYSKTMYIRKKDDGKFWEKATPAVEE